MKALLLLPRLIRQRDAPNYVGMSEPEFNKLVRPFVTVIREPGKRSVSYDRLDLDAWADEYKAANGRPGQEKELCLRKLQASEKEAKSGTLRKPSTESSFAKALECVTSQTRKGT